MKVRSPSVQLCIDFKHIRSEGTMLSPYQKPSLDMLNGLYPASTPKKRLLPFSGELGKIKAGSLCSAEHIYVLAIFCRIHSYTKLVLQNTQKSRKLVLQNTQKSRWS